MKDIHCYDDIIGIEYHGPLRHMRMKKSARAAQFAPFAALSGHGDAIDEEARLVDSERVQCEDALEELDLALREAAAKIGTGQKIRVTYFVPDDRKDGGRYETAEGELCGIDEFERTLKMSGGRRIFLDRICKIEAAV